jgi:hypothetical protein
MGMLYRALSTGFVAPCLSTKAHKPAFGIGLRARARRLWHPQGRQLGVALQPACNNLTHRSPLVAEGLHGLRSRRAFPVPFHFERCAPQEMTPAQLPIMIMQTIWMA